MAAAQPQERQSAAWMALAQAGDQIAYASLLAMLTGVTRRFARQSSCAKKPFSQLIVVGGSLRS